MENRKRRGALFVAVLVGGTFLASMALPGIGWGQSGKPPAKAGVVPAGVTVDSVLAKAGAALGGGAAIAKITTIVQKGTISINTQTLAMTGSIESYVKLPSSYYSKQVITQRMEGRSQTVTIEMASDGKAGWMKMGEGAVRTMPAQQLAQMADSAALQNPADWRKSFNAAELLGIRKVDGKEAYAIRLTPKTGSPTVRYYDTKTYLVARMDIIQDSPQGPQPIEMYFSDYRKVGAIPMPYTVRQRYAGADATTKLSSIQVNVPIPASRFARPAK